MKNKSTLISFLGSRGSGKTTIANIVYENLNRDGQVCIRQHPGFKKHPLLPGLATAISLWRFFDFRMMKSFGFVGRRKRKMPSMYRIYLPLAFSHDLHQLKKRRANFLIYDSNVLRGLIAAVNNGEIEIQEILDLYQDKILSKVEILFVVVDTDPAEAVRRWIERDKAQLTENEIAEEVSARVKLMENINFVIDALSKLPNVEIQRLDGGDSPEKNAEIVSGRFSK